ncbi:porin family protein [Vibrio breoganii]|uniref:porin family protein n=1 Tax=Vibrio breoganii TaxID=553239 RepID=UPI000C831AE1|nr:porin family protein [Vibrio breoganii]PMK38983.1 hypothetical protein BCU00_17305 [Vibrio breoganii]
MNKSIVLGCILFLSSPSLVYAKDFNGFRIGGGYTFSYLISVDDDDVVETGDYGDGFKVEAGYDFNRIFGLNVSYQENSYDESNYFGDAKLSGSTIKIDADIGYAIDFGGWWMKPYGAVGLAIYDEDYTVGQFKFQYDENAPLLGAGIRFTGDSGAYFNIRQDFVLLSDATMGQTSLTIGYMF